MRNNNTDNIIDNKEIICKYADTVAGLLRPRKEELVDLLMSNDQETKDDELLKIENELIKIDTLDLNGQNN